MIKIINWVWTQLTTHFSPVYSKLTQSISMQVQVMTGVGDLLL